MQVLFKGVYKKKVKIQQYKTLNTSQAALHHQWEILQRHCTENVLQQMHVYELIRLEETLGIS